MLRFRLAVFLMFLSWKIFWSKTPILEFKKWTNNMSHALIKEKIDLHAMSAKELFDKIEASEKARLLARKREPLRVPANLPLNHTYETFKGSK